MKEGWVDERRVQKMECMRRTMNNKKTINKWKWSGCGRGVEECEKSVKGV